MRRLVFMAGATAAVAGAAVWVRRSRGAASAGAPGVLPGRFGSWVNAYFDRPLHAAVAEVVREAGGEPIRSRVGHSFIKQVMAETGAASEAETMLGAPSSAE